MGDDGLPERGSLTYLIRNTQQELVAVSNQADVKASIVITAAALVVGIAASNLHDSSVRWSLVTFLVVVLAAMFLAIVAVLPKHPRAMPKGADFNPLFFGHFARMSRDEFVDTVAGMVQQEDGIYRAQLADLHARGQYIERSKFRFVRWSYMVFFAAFAIASTQQLITELVR